MAKSDSAVARRYAGALFNTAEAQGQIAQAASGLEEVASTLAESKELVAVVNHPFLGRDKKRQILRSLFQSRVTPLVTNFLDLVVEKERANFLPQMQTEFARLVDESNHEADGEVVSAIPLTPAQRTALVAGLHAKFGVKVRLTEKVDPEILGGLVLKVGDKLLDGSVNSRLQRLNEQLKRTKVS